MRVTLINLWDKGGMIHYFSQLTNALAKTEEVTVIIPDSASSNYFNKNINIKRIKVPTEASLKELVSFPSKLIRIPFFLKTVRDTNPDVIHITSGHPWSFMAMPFLKKYKIFVTLHDPEPHVGEKHLRKILSIRMSLKYATKIFVHGKQLRNLLTNKISKNKIEIIPHGDYSFFTKWEDNSVHEERSVLFFGRILDYKGIQYLIQAEPLIAKEIEDIKIIIAGKGNLRKYEKLIKNKNNFEIINEFIPDEKVARLFQRCAVVVLPYIDGTQSGIIPIAYSFKKPVIATNVGSIPEVVENGRTGYIIEPRNSKILAESITKLLKDDNLRKQMGDNAYTKMKEELSWDKIAEKTVMAYKSVVRRGPSSGHGRCRGLCCRGK